jgi:hypothetical protein
MVISISLSPELEDRLKAKAAAAGLDMATFASRTLERVAARPSLDEVLEPLRAEFYRSGMSENELTEFLEQAKHEARTERRARQAS